MAAGLRKGPFGTWERTMKSNLSGMTRVSGGWMLLGILAFAAGCRSEGSATRFDMRYASVGPTSITYIAGGGQVALVVWKDFASPC